jgi:hypothetical protein
MSDDLHLTGLAQRTHDGHLRAMRTRGVFVLQAPLIGQRIIMSQIRNKLPQQAYSNERLRASIGLHGCRLINRALNFAASWTRLIWESCEFNDVLIATRGQAYCWVLALSTRIARRLRSVWNESEVRRDLAKSGAENRRRSPIVRTRGANTPVTVRCVLPKTQTPFSRTAARLSVDGLR